MVKSKGHTIQWPRVKDTPYQSNKSKQIRTNKQTNNQTNQNKLEQTNTQTRKQIKTN